MRIPVNTKVTALLVKGFLSLFEFDSMAFFASLGGCHGFIIMQGNSMIATNGIHAMICNIAEDTGMTESEVVQIITKTQYKTD